MTMARRLPHILQEDEWSALASEVEIYDANPELLPQEPSVELYWKKVSSSINFHPQ